MIKKLYLLVQNRQVDQWNRIEDPEMNSNTYEHLIFDKEPKTMHWKKKTTFSTNGSGSTGSQHAEECKLLFQMNLKIALSNSMKN